MPTTTSGEGQPLSAAPLQSHSAVGCLRPWEVSHCPWELESHRRRTPGVPLSKLSGGVSPDFGLPTKCQCFKAHPSCPLGRASQSHQRQSPCPAPGLCDRTVTVRDVLQSSPWDASAISKKFQGV